MVEDDGGFGKEISILSDANPHGDNAEYPFLVFNSKDGTFVIADDYETGNDMTAREFTVTKNDAVSLAMALLQYVQEGTTTKRRSNTESEIIHRVLKR
jgi:hypothetical protein